MKQPPVCIPLTQEENIHHSREQGWNPALLSPGRAGTPSPSTPTEMVWVQLPGTVGGRRGRGVAACRGSQDGPGAPGQPRPAMSGAPTPPPQQPCQPLAPHPGSQERGDKVTWM